MYGVGFNTVNKKEINKRPKFLVTTEKRYVRLCCGSFISLTARFLKIRKLVYDGWLDFKLIQHFTATLLTNSSGEFTLIWSNRNGSERVKKRIL